MKFNNYKIEKNKPLASFTWFNVGGMSKYYFQTRNVESLENYLKFRNQIESKKYKLFDYRINNQLILK